MFKPKTATCVTNL